MRVSAESCRKVRRWHAPRCGTRTEFFFLDKAECARHDVGFLLFPDGECNPRSIADCGPRLAATWDPTGTSSPKDVRNADRSATRPGSPSALQNIGQSASTLRL